MSWFRSLEILNSSLVLYLTNLFFHDFCLLNNAHIYFCINFLFSHLFDCGITISVLSLFPISARVHPLMDVGLFQTFSCRSVWCYLQSIFPSDLSDVIHPPPLRSSYTPTRCPGSQIDDPFRPFRAVLFCNVFCPSPLQDRKYICDPRHRRS